MKNLTAKFLYLLIDIIESMVWAFKNNYLFEAWRNIEWGGYEVSAKETLLTPEKAEQYYLDDLKRNNPNIQEPKEDLWALAARSSAYASAQAAQAAMESAQIDNQTSGFKEHVRREEKILMRLKPIPIWYGILPILLSIFHIVIYRGK